jgi:hypothetical protein
LGELQVWPLLSIEAIPLAPILLDNTAVKNVSIDTKTGEMTFPDGTVYNDKATQSNILTAYNTAISNMQATVSGWFKTEANPTAGPVVDMVAIEKAAYEKFQNHEDLDKIEANKD